MKAINRNTALKNAVFLKEEVLFSTQTQKPVQCAFAMDDLQQSKKFPSDHSSAFFPYTSLPGGSNYTHTKDRVAGGEIEARDIVLS